MSTVKFRKVPELSFSF